MKTKGKVKGSTMSISAEKIQSLEKAARSEELQRVLELLSDMEPNYKTINQVKKIISNLRRSVASTWREELDEDDNIITLILKTLLILETNYWQKEKEEVVELIERSSRHENWNIRRLASEMLEALIEDDHSNIDILASYTESEHSQLKRLSLLTAKAIVSSARFEQELKEDILHSIQNLISEEDPYVETVLQETFREGFMRNEPELTFEWINENISSFTSSHAKSTILNITSARYTREYPDEVLNIVDHYLSDSTYQVKKARSATLRNLAESHQELVSSFLEQRLENKNAVDHWAELEVDGDLNVFEF